MGSSRSLSEWLFELEHRHVKEIHLGLERVTQVARRLDVQSFPVPVVLIGGTNGKGSTVAALDAIYSSAGYSVGAYTSPHLLRFNERIRVAGKTISDNDLCLLFETIEAVRDDVFLSYFEMATLAALLYFKQSAVDIILLEVGLGGRLDATNCVEPDISIITTVDYDHQEFLGTTLDAIGFEKAGILRADKPFVYADEAPPNTVLEVANQINAKGMILGQDYWFDLNDENWSLRTRTVHFEKLPLPGLHLNAAASAIVASTLIQDRLPIGEEDIRAALPKMFVAGRQQMVQLDDGVDALFDVSHNPQSARLLSSRLTSMKPQGKILAVFSALKDKDISGMILPLKDCIHRWFPAQLDIKRATSRDDLIHSFESAHISIDFCYTNPVLAWEHAREEALPGDLIVVFGSFYTVGAVMTHIQNN